MSDLSVALDSVAFEEFNSPEARALLNAIDDLRELQVGDIVDLPQIIVVGDQSAGKSSVLEAISRVRFPAKGDICTRFATELRLRRAPETRIAVSIESHGSGSSYQFHRTSFDKDELPGIISEAAERMGVQPSSGKGFSRDILRVEVAGPSVYPLTVVDLPGFFHAATSDQSQEGKKIARELAESYMQQPKSIILAVVSANQNLANQIVIQEARKHDPNRERTLGIITKPDLAPPNTLNASKCQQLIRGQESMHKLKLGWHLLRNRPEGKEDMGADERDAEEDRFFQTSEWCSVLPSSRGIVPLRKKLSKVLLEHIKKTLPNLTKEIEAGLSTRQQALDRLGKPRLEPDDLRAYLFEIADRFQRLTRDAIDGRYNDDFFGDLYDSAQPRKLRALLRKLTRAFHATLVTKGVDREIEWEDEDRIPSNDHGLDWISSGEDAPEYLEPYLRLFDGLPEPTYVPETDLCEELEQLAASNLGTEFPGLPNGNLAFQLFKMQAKPWSGIAELYLDQAVNLAESFVEDLFIHIIGADKQTANAVLTSCVVDFFQGKRKLLKTKLQEISQPYVAAYGPPLDAEFHAALSSRIVKREAGRVASLLEEVFPTVFTDKAGKALTREQVEQAIGDAEKNRVREFGTEKVIDLAMTHFQVRYLNDNAMPITQFLTCIQISLTTFAENVVNLAVESCLISDLPTIMTPSMVIRMDEERLKELVSESEDVRLERNALQQEVKILREGLKKCQMARLHERTG